MVMGSGWQETITLPVGYVANGNGELHHEVTLRKMTGNEEALLSDAKLRNNGGKLISALLANCVVEMDGIDRVTPASIKRMYSADRNYLLLELRRLTFGDEMEAHYRCTRCHGVTAVVEDLSELEIRRLDDPDADDLEFTVELKDGYRDPDGNWHQSFIFSLPKGEDEEASASRKDTNPSRQRDALLARCLKQAGEMESRRIQALGVRIMADLSMSDRRLIQRTLDEQAPGPDLIRNVVCDHCGDEFRTTLDMSQFFPLE